MSPMMNRPVPQPYPLQWDRLGFNYIVYPVVARIAALVGVACRNSRKSSILFGLTAPRAMAAYLSWVY
jgi:hypothetical protein